MKKKQVIKHIAGWLKSYCSKSTMKGFVVGVSGGIDSALTSTLCALTKMPVIVLNMPIRQNRKQYDLAAMHIDWLKKNFHRVSAYEVDLTQTFLQLKKALPGQIQDDHSMANTRSRLRMLALYAVSTHHRMLVAGTGNKVEDFGIGFFTKYGDGGVDISPIADLMKSEVYALAHELQISKPILDAAPVDGLWADNRTDEQQIGASYDELEKAMQYLSQTATCLQARQEVRRQKSEGKSQKRTAREKEVIKIYQRLHSMNEHKMKPIPVCLIPAKLKK